MAEHLTHEKEHFTQLLTSITHLIQFQHVNEPTVEDISLTTETFTEALIKKALSYFDSAIAKARSPPASVPAQHLPPLVKDPLLPLGIVFASMHNTISRYHMHKVVTTVEECLPDIIESTIFPINALSGANLTRRDLNTVHIRGTWLNDEVINAQVALLNEACPFVAFVTTHFYNTLVVKGPLGVDQWLRSIVSKEVDAFAIPMNLGNTHWVACAVHLRLHFILYFDSLGAANVPAVVPILKLLVASAQFFGLTAETIRARFIVLFPGRVCTFQEIEEEEGLVDELDTLVNKRATKEPQSAMPLINSKDSDNRSAGSSVISISSTLSSIDPEDSTSPNATAKQSSQPTERYPFYYTCEESKLPLKAAFGRKAFNSVDKQKSWNSHSIITMCRIATNLDHASHLHMLIESLRDTGLRALLELSIADLVPLDVDSAEKTILRYCTKHAIDVSVVSAAEAVMLSVNMPRQDNGSDCGLYVIMFLKLLARQFGPGYPMTPRDSVRARSLVTAEICLQRLITSPMIRF